MLDAFEELSKQSLQEAIIKILLETYGSEVIEAVDGLEAIKGIRQEVPDLILMDISMHEMDGLTAMKDTRQMKCGAEIPIFAVTASGKNFYK